MIKYNALFKSYIFNREIQRSIKCNSSKLYFHDWQTILICNIWFTSDLAIFNIEISRLFFLLRSTYFAKKKKKNARINSFVQAKLVLQNFLIFIFTLVNYILDFAFEEYNVFFSYIILTP